MAVPPVPTPLVTLQGVLERIRFTNQENGWTVALFAVKGEREECTIVGMLAGIPVGSALALSGAWVNDPKFGRQFRVERFEMLKPNTVRGIERYLGSGLVKGIGPRYAARIVARFGLATLDILDREPDRLLEVEGLGAKRVESIKAAWLEQRAIHRIMVFLQGHGISATYAVKIFKTYGAASLTVVEENPYRLAEDIWGIGFKIADRIAQSLGIPSRDPRRARAGLIHALNEAAGNGHTYLPRERLLGLCGELLDLPADTIVKELPAMAAEERLVIEGDAVYLPSLCYAEKGCAASLALMSRGVSAFSGIQAGVAVDWAAARMRITLSGEQKAAVEAALANKVLVLTGGPGTGKSTILKVLVMIVEAKGARLSLAAPTGRAAKRMGEASGREARTVHRLLEYDPSTRGFRRGREHPIEADMVVVDEVSMLDVVLANALFRAVAPTASLVLVGDADQLPSVGPGDVLKDCIASARLPVIRLTRIFRQSEGSLISVNAARINRGEPLDLLPDYRGRKDFYAIFREEVADVAHEVLGLVAERLPGKYGFDPLRDIQVLTPMRKGVIGSEQLNRDLQGRLNKGEGTEPGAALRFRPGDKVMQIRNNYDKEVFNGDIGIIAGVEKEEDGITVDFDGRRVSYEASEQNELELAYAVTVHKAQGSEFPCVVIPLHTTHYPLLQRKLLYTAVTRGRRLVVLVASRKALALAIGNSREEARASRLAERLAGG